MPIELKKAEVESIFVSHKASGWGSQQDSEEAIRHGSRVTVDSPRSRLTWRAYTGIPLVFAQVHPTFPLCGTLQRFTISQKPSPSMQEQAPICAAHVRQVGENQSQSRSAYCHLGRNVYYLHVNL